MFLNYFAFCNYIFCSMIQLLFLEIQYFSCFILIEMKICIRTLKSILFYNYIYILHCLTLHFIHTENIQKKTQIMHHKTNKHIIEREVKSTAFLLFVSAGVSFIYYILLVTCAAWMHKQTQHTLTVTFE